MNRRCWLITVCLMGVFAILTFKNPFSIRSLIPNLEPYPDTLYYSVPSWNLLKGRGFKMEAFGMEVKKIVPPVYGIYLWPYFLIFGDVRAFYFGNLILSLVSIFLFGQITRTIFKNNYWVSIILELFLVMNYYFYTWPSLMMAENISLMLFLLALFFILVDENNKRWLIGAFLSIFLLLFTKYSNFPVVISLFLLVCLRVFSQYKISLKKSIKFLVIPAIFLITAVLFLMVVNWQGVFNSPYFSFKFVSVNLGFYINGLIGKPTDSLWFRRELVDFVPAVLSVVGVVAGLIIKKYRKLVVEIILLVVPLIIFMSTFWSSQARYIQVLLPVWLLAGGVTLSLIYEIINNKVFWLITAFLLGGLLLTKVDGQYKILDLKKQVAINFKYREDPWNYICLTKFKLFLDGKKDYYFGSFLPPYYYLFFMDNNFKFVPLSDGQEFMGKGLKSYYDEPLNQYYISLLNNNKKIYYSDYYVSNVLSWRTDLINNTKGLVVEKVYADSNDVCNVYELKSLAE